MTKDAIMKQASIRLVVALGSGVVIATLVPFLRPWIPLWTWRVVIASAVMWWVLPKIVPQWRQASGSTNGKPFEIREGNMMHGRQWFVVLTRPAPLPKRLTAFGLFFGLLFAFFGVLFTPTHSAFIGEGGTHFVVFLIIGLPVGVWVLRFLGNRSRKLVGTTFGLSADAVRLPNGEVILRTQIDHIALRNTQQQGALLVGGAGMPGAAMVMHADSRNRLAEVSYAVMVEHQGQVSVLAAGLSSPQAAAVFKAVNDRLGFV
jgi:hypothetical protein